jgi:hypothetical protein
MRLPGLWGRAKPLHAWQYIIEHSRTRQYDARVTRSARGFVDRKGAKNTNKNNRGKQAPHGDSSRSASSLRWLSSAPPHAPRDALPGAISPGVIAVLFVVDGSFFCMLTLFPPRTRARTTASSSSSSSPDPGATPDIGVATWTMLLPPPPRLAQQAPKPPHLPRTQTKKTSSAPIAAEVSVSAATRPAHPGSSGASACTPGAANAKIIAIADLISTAGGIFPFFFCKA